MKFKKFEHFVNLDAFLKEMNSILDTN